MTALEALNLAAPLADTYSAVEQRLLVAIARQLTLNDNHALNEVSKWQIKQLANMGMLSKQAHSIIAKGTKGVPADFADTVRQAIESTLAEDGLVDMWKNEGFSESAKNAVKHYRQQAQDVYNQVNTVMKYKAESTFVRAVNSVADKWSTEMRRNQPEIADKQGVLDILNSNTASVVSGSTARTKAVRTTIHEMAQRGIPAFVDKAGREWSPEAYVNMDIRATVKNTALDTQFGVMDSLGQDVFEVSSHPGSRPKCRPWQGKLISRSGKTTEITDIKGKKHKVIPLSQTSFGEPDGLFGINCGHRPRGVSDGLFRKSEVEYNDEEDKALYTKVCCQRELERKVRRSKTEADMLEAAGDTEGAKAVRQRLTEQNRQLRAYCEENGLKYRSDRVRTYGSVNADKKTSVFEARELELEKAKTTGKGKHPLNVRAINTKEYTDKFNGVGRNHTVDVSLRNTAISIMNHRDGTSFEDLVYLDARTGAMKFIINDSNTPYGVAHSPECDEFLKSFNGSLIVLHNHPGGSRPSYSDIRLAIGYDYKTEKIVYGSIEKSVIAGHNGKVYIIGDIVHDEKIGKTLDKLYTEVYNYFEGTTGNKEFAADKALDAVYAKGKELKAFTIKEL